MKFLKYTGDAFTGVVSIKLDGVQSIRKDGAWFSRNGKPLYNLPEMPEGVYEYYRKDWSTSISDVRTHDGTPLEERHLYALSPTLDSRLLVCEGVNIPEDVIMELFRRVVRSGAEGLVLLSHNGVIRYKVKTVETYDVEVTGYLKGKGRHMNRMGALLTPIGKVGTGFTDDQREQYKEEFILGKTIEVACMEITNSGKARHPYFVRLREDK